MRIFAALDLPDAALSTSGDYERFFIKNGRRYPPHHRPRPRRAGRRLPQRHHRRRSRGDGRRARRPGVFVLGPAAGMALIERLPEVGRGDRHGRQRGAGVERTEGSTDDRGGTHGSPAVGGGLLSVAPATALATRRALLRTALAALPTVIVARETASTSAPIRNGSRMLFPWNCAANSGRSTEK